MATRLLLVAHAATEATRGVRFAAPEDPVEPPLEPVPVRRRFVAAERGPEARAAETATSLGLQAIVDVGWADLDCGSWTGRALAEVADEDPASVGAWIDDQSAAPHGGESVEDLVTRVDAMVSRDRQDGPTVVVTAPAVLRAVVVAVLGAPATAYQHVDVGPLDGLEISVERGRRAVRRLRPFPQWTG